MLLLCAVASAVWISCCNCIDDATESYARYLLKSNAVAKLYGTLSSELSTFNTSNMVTQDRAGDITVLTVNADLINTAVIELTNKANTILSMRDFCTISIPLGSMSGIRLLSGLGPPIKIKSIPVGNAVGDVKSNMISAGINQVNHRITVTISACIALMYPFEDCICNISTELLLCETIIIGSVPEIVVG